MRRAIRATLIQNTSEFQTYLSPYLNRVMENYATTGVVYEDALEWIVAEELELIHLLFDRKHQHRRRALPYLTIYWDLKAILPIDLSACVSYYLAAPRLYGDLEIKISFVGPDLYLKYHSDPYEAEPVIVTLHSPITKK